MRSVIYFALFFLSWLSQMVGSTAVIVLFFGGIYVLLVESILIGFAMIGASVAAAWLFKLVSGLLLTAAIAVINVKIEKEKY